MIINWKTTKEEAILIGKITRRAVETFNAFKRAGVDINMDITACHANGCPLKLAELLAASELDFSHDIFGINRHIDRETGKLGNCFLPRYAQPETPAKPAKPEPKLFDVVAVSIESRKVTGIFGTNKTEENAEAIIKMAIARRGLDTEFYADVPAGKYKEGDLYEN